MGLLFICDPKIADCGKKKLVAEWFGLRNAQPEGRQTIQKF